MVATARGAVFWPENVSFPKEIVETFPASVPPMRSDRDIILIGRLSQPGAFNVTCDVIVDGKKVELKWPVQSEASNSEFAFLPKLIEQSRADAGVSMPTLGSAGLREAGRMILASSTDLTKLARQAKARGASSDASMLASAALRSNPDNTEALVLKKASNTKVTLAEASAAPKVQDDQDLEDRTGAGRAAEIAQSLVAGRIRAEIRNELETVRDLMRTSPSDAIQRLKLAMETIGNSTDLDDESKAQLGEKLDSALKQAQAQSVAFAEAEAEQQARLARARELAREEEDSARSRQKMVQLMAQFKSLIDEEKYQLAFTDISPEIELEARERPCKRSRNFIPNSRQMLTYSAASVNFVIANSSPEFFRLKNLLSRSMIATLSSIQTKNFGTRSLANAKNTKRLTCSIRTAPKPTSRRHWAKRRRIKIGLKSR